MSGELRTDPPPPGRRQAMARARYVPLVVLMICVVVATVVGRMEIRSDADRSSSQDTPDALHASLPAACAPRVDQGLTSEPWRDQTVREASEETFRQRTAAEHPAYIKGRDDWLFFSDVQVQDFSQAIGRQRLTASQVRAWVAYLSEMRRDVEAQGGQFYIVVAPAKWDVYPQKLPMWAQKLRGSNSLDRLMHAHPELPFVDVRSALRGAEELTYSPLDSHWSLYGGHVAWEAATACLRAANDANSGLRVPEISGVDLVADNNEFAADGVKLPVEPSRTQPVYAKPHPATTVTSIQTGASVAPGPLDTIDMLDLPVETRTPDAQSDQTLLAFRDSTGSALSGQWSASFNRTIQYQHPIGGMGAPVDVPALVEKYRPDITIFSMTERYLALGPPSEASKR